MKKFVWIIGAAIVLISCQKTDENIQDMPSSYDTYPTYQGSDLGVSYSPKKTTIKVWSPAAQEVKVKLYTQGLGGQNHEEHSMIKAPQGTWVLDLDGDRKGTFYTVQTKTDSQWNMEKPDPYAIAVGTNGERGCIIDISETDPDGWTEDQKPSLVSPTDVVIYELHVRDLSIHPSSGIQHRGKFLGLTETHTASPAGTITGLEHIRSLGVTHVHLLPSFDYASVDESKLDSAQFNWGYDPKNYNVPEGSYSTDPSDPKARIIEFKQMVKTLHEHGLRVVMDVVYNHTYSGDDSPLNQVVPGYYYRHTDDGNHSNASGCGNETASERPMMRKYMIQSLKHWVKEYHVDGFRFDLMAIHDIETMNQISRELNAIDPTIFLYGEGWTAGKSPLAVEDQALKKNTYRLDQIAAFSDDIRDGIKGAWHDVKQKGFASGDTSISKKENVKYGIIGGISHPQIDHSILPNVPKAWAGRPSQAINYVACHDNHTLWDRLLESNPDHSDEERIKMHLLSNTIVFTSQGIPFLHAGEEFLRTKYGEENSYNKPDAINQLDWDRKGKYQHIVDFYQKLIALRKNHPIFRMPSSDMINANLRFEEQNAPSLIVYSLNGTGIDDTWDEVYVSFNGSSSAQKLTLPAGTWRIVLEGQLIDEQGLKTVSGEVAIPGFTAKIFVKKA